jgi:membrane protein implicated in regulation of membrane protease activity
VLSLMWQLLALSLWPVVLVVLVAVGMFLALIAFDRMYARIERRVDRDVTAAERGPDNVVYLTERIEADHRRQRVMRLLERS